jgi:hypothetical protein
VKTVRKHSVDLRKIFASENPGKSRKKHYNKRERKEIEQQVRKTSNRRI